MTSQFADMMSSSNFFDVVLFLLSIIKKKEKKHDKIVLLGILKLNIIEVLISKALINSNISHDEFVLINNLLKEYDQMKKKSKI